MHPLEGSASHLASMTTSTSRLGRIALAFAILLALLVTAGTWAPSPAAAADLTILGTSAPPELVEHTDADGVEVGTRFTARSDGSATGMRFWKGQNAVEPHVGTLWSAQGEKLARATFSNESGTGWQSAEFDRTIALTEGRTYVVSYYAANGRYAVTQDSTARSLSPDLSIQDGFGVFKYGSTTQFPTSTYRDSSYWVDVVFSPDTVTTPTPTDLTIWGTSAPPELVEHTDADGVEVGTRFTARSDGSATGMRFWKGQNAVEPHVGTLWSAQGEKLARATFSNESGTGWQSAEFDRTIALTEGRTYVVSYYAANGRYAVTQDSTARSLSPDLSIQDGFGVFTYGSTTQFPTGTYRDSSYWVDVVFSPDTVTTAPSPTPTPIPEPTLTPEPTPTPTPDPAPTSEPDPTPVPEVPAPATGFPTAANTGVPVGTTLATYTGPCSITASNVVIDAKTVNCDLRVTGENLKITRSVINGTVYTATGNSVGSFNISDSEVRVGNRPGTGLGDKNFTATRVEVTGGNRSVNCYLNCTIESSYVHQQFADTSGVYHESGVRMGSGAIIRGNTIACDAPDFPPDAGCSAALTGYGDFDPVRNNLIDGNLFIGNSGGYCTYGGSSGGKPYSSAAGDIRFTNNVWQRGESGKCGFYGPITSFDSNAPGNVWNNNTWEDGSPVQAAN